jgi:RimJ/RimL family protein N-acetyltransferase
VIALNIYKLRNGSECIIRRAVEKDTPDIVKYSNIVGGESDFLSYGRNEFSHSVEQERVIIREYSETNNRLFIVAVIDGNIVGMLTFWGNGRRRLEHWGEFGVSVLKRYQNIGVGSALLDYMIEWAKRSKLVRKVDLMVREDNYQAINLYEKMGFEVEGRIRRAMKVDDKFYNFLYMGRLID